MTPLEVLVVSSFGPLAEALHRLAAGLPLRLRFATDFAGLRGELEARRPDVVLVDRWLLGDAAPRCVALARTAYDLPAVLLVGRPEEGEDFPEKVDGVLVKPLQRGDLEALLAQWQPEAAPAAGGEGGRPAPPTDAAGALRLLDEVRETLRRLAEVIQVDSLTGLYHRDVFLDRGAREVLRARRYGQPLSLLLLDVDDFKAINDRHGHERGNQVLALLGRLLQESIRRELDLAARLHGDELAVLLPATPLAGARRLAERLQEKIAQVKEPLSFRVTIGAAELTGEALAPGLPALLRAADEALLRGKKAGKGGIHLAGAAAPPPASPPPTPLKALVVTPEPEVGRIFAEAFAAADLPVETAPDRAAALGMLDSLEFFAVFLDGDPEAADVKLFLDGVRRVDPRLEIFLFVPPGREEGEGEGLHRVAKPFRLRDLVAAAREARERYRHARAERERE